MRVVVYSDEDLEPITVLQLPLTERDIERHERIWRVLVPEKISFSRKPPTEAEPTRIVELWFERFVRERGGRRQVSWMCFTKADELVMLLDPDWLPGQRSTVSYLQEQSGDLAKLLMKVLSS